MAFGSNPYGTDDSNGSSFMNNPMLGMGGMMFGGGLGQLLGMKNPSNSAMPYLNQIPGMMQNYYNPYISAGQNAMGQLMPQYQNMMANGGTLNNQYSQLVNDPTHMMNQIGSTYHQSPGYQWQVDQATKAANNAAAAGGMLGSPAEQQQLAQNVNGLANQDYYHYMDQGMNSYGQGLQGMQGMFNQGLQGMQGINEMGYGASNSLAENIAQAMMSQAMMKYAGQANQNQSQGGGLGSMLGGIASILMSS